MTISEKALSFTTLILWLIIPAANAQADQCPPEFVTSNRFNDSMVAAFSEESDGPFAGISVTYTVPTITRSGEVLFGVALIGTPRGLREECWKLGQLDPASLSDLEKRVKLLRHSKENIYESSVDPKFCEVAQNEFHFDSYVIADPWSIGGWKVVMQPTPTTGRTDRCGGLSGSEPIALLINKWTRKGRELLAAMKP
jgi:hypothetical protein